MGALTMGALCAGVALGVLITVAGIRGHQILPSAPRLFGGDTTAERALAVAAAAAFAGIATFMITGWPVAAVAAFVGVISGPRAMSGRAARADMIARTEAIASWAELIRDNMAGAAGLEQALLASAEVCPQAIANEVGRFVRRLDHEPLGDALAALGNDLNHPSSDLIVAALANAARMEGRDIGALLSRLADSTRADVRMRLRVEVGRARIRTSARIVIGVTAFTMLFLYVFSRSLLNAYDTTAGQLWLVVVFAIFALGLWLMNAYGQIEMPERFSARRHSSSAHQGQQ